ncbi:hypothetical protein ACQP0C_27230 [Nocardia sp. CA-129566]|uniref:hypothetical protein n=1 Tax=Nocardia sp. CA-129566 TaxID=3239976 RepID=UPI003D99AF15
MADRGINERNEFRGSDFGMRGTQMLGLDSIDGAGSPVDVGWFGSWQVVPAREEAASARVEVGDDVIEDRR